MYVRFLDQEIRFRYRGPVLVVMPAGIGFTRADATPQAERRALSTVHVATGRDGLAATAILAVARLAARSGHPIVPAAIRRPPAAGHGTVWLVVAGAWLCWSQPGVRPSSFAGAD